MPSRLVPIDSVDDPRLAPFRARERSLASRPERRDDAGAGLFVAEGDLVVERALDAGCVPVAAIADADHPPPVVDRLGIDVLVAGPAVRRTATGLAVPLGVVALFRRPPRARAAEVLATSRRVVVLEQVDNPVNVGAVARNAAALGWDALVVDRTSADPLARRALRVAMGTTFSIVFARADDLAAALRAERERGRRDGDPLEVLALTPAAGAVAIDHVAPAGASRRAVVIGSERAGLGDDVLALADALVRIPMTPAVDSLNAAAAAAIACHVLDR